MLDTWSKKCRQLQQAFILIFVEFPSYNICLRKILKTQNSTTKVQNLSTSNQNQHNKVQNLSNSNQNQHKQRRHTCVTLPPAPMQ